MPPLPYSGVQGQQAAGTINVGLPDDYQRINAPAGAFGASTAAAATQLGGALEKAGGTALEIATRWQDMQDTAALSLANSTLRQQVTTTSWGDPNDPQSRGFLSMQGSDALNGYQGAVQAIQQKRDEIAATLTPRQQAVFARTSQLMLDDTAGKFDEYRARQQVDYSSKIATSSAQTAQSAAIANFADETSFRHNLADGLRNIDNLADLNGWAPEFTNQKRQQFISDSRLGAVARLRDVNPDAAWSYYQSHQGELTGQDQLRAESMIRPAREDWAARDLADNIWGRNSGGLSPAAPAILAQAQSQGVGASLALTAASIESGIGTNPKANANQAGAYGLFQMTPGTWAARGGTADSRSDPDAQAKFGVANLAHSQQVASGAVPGGHAADWQAYLVHQQGDAGGAALLKADPNQAAAAALAPAYGGNAAAARSAITGNGGSPDMTVGQFLTMWQQKYEAAAAQVARQGASLNGARSNVPAMLDEARGALDPYGQDNPVFQDKVMSRIRARQNLMEYGQRETEKANRDVLFGAAMGLPSSSATPGGAQQSPDAGVPGADPSAASPGVAPAPVSAPGQPAPVPTRPTSLDQLFQNPAAKAAWSSATPDTQRSVMAMVEHNAQGTNPPITPQSQALYSQLTGMAVNSRDEFQKLNLADPQYLAQLPHSYWNALLAEQRRFGTQDVAQASREATQAHALSVMKPDLLAAGVKVDGLKPGSTPAQTYNQFVGRIGDALDQFQQQNKRKPDDGEIRKIGQTLLLQGTERGSGWLWDSGVRAFQTTPDKFVPSVPGADRQGIVAAYKQSHGGQEPTDGQVQEIWMRARAKDAAPRPRPGASGSGMQGMPAVPMNPAALPPAPADTDAVTPRGY